MRAFILAAIILLSSYSLSLAEDIKTAEKLDAQLDVVNQLLGEARTNIKELSKNVDLAMLQIQEVRVTLKQETRRIDDNRRDIKDATIYVAEIKKKIDEQTFEIKIFSRLASFFCAVIALIVGFAKWQYITKTTNIIIRRLQK